MAVPVSDRLHVAAGWAWRLLVIGVAAVLAALALMKLSLVVIPVVLALFLSTLLVPPTRFLRARGWRDGLAAAVVFVGGLAILVGVGAIVGPPVVREFGELDVNVREGADTVAGWVGPTFGISERSVERAIDRAAQELQGNAGAIGGGILSGAVIAIEVAIGILLALVLLFFFVKDGERLWGFVVGLFPPRERARVDELGVRAYRTLGGYVRGIAAVGVVDAVLIGGFLVVLGVPLVLPLAVLVFLGSFFPLVGAWVSGMAAALVTLVDQGWGRALLVVAWITAVQQLEGHLLYPVVVGRAIRLHPVPVLLALVAGGLLGGLAGAFLAVPAVAVAASWLEYLRSGA